MDAQIHSLIMKQVTSAKPQPPDPNHTRLSKEVIYKWGQRIKGHTVLDVGCGSGFAKQFWEDVHYKWAGAVVGKDHGEASKMGPTMHADMHMFGYTDYRYDVIYARHVLEHSPFPMLALANWRKMAEWCIVVVPRLDQAVFGESTHLSVLPIGSWRRYFQFAEWIVEEHESVDYNNPVPWPQSGGEWRFLLR